MQSEFFFFIEIIRAKLHRIYETLDRLKREVVTAQMRMQKVETDCPSDWSPIKGELDDLFGTIGSSVDRAWRDLFLGEVGGTQVSGAGIPLSLLREIFFYNDRL